MGAISEVRGEREYNVACAERSILLYSEGLKRGSLSLPDRKLCAVRTIQAAIGVPFRFVGIALSVAGNAIGILFAPCAGEGKRLGMLAYRVIWVLLSPIQVALNVLSVALRITSIALGVLMPCLAIRGLKLVEQLDWLEYRVDAAISQKCIVMRNTESVLREIDPTNAKWYLDEELATTLYKSTEEYAATNATWQEKLASESETLLKEILSKKLTDQSKILGVIPPSIPLPDGAHPANFDPKTHQAVQQMCTSGVVDPKEFKNINLVPLLAHFKMISGYVKSLVNGQKDEEQALSPWQKGIMEALEKLSISTLRDVHKLLEKSLEQITTIQSCDANFGGIYVIHEKMPAAKSP